MPSSKPRGDRTRLSHISQRRKKGNCIFARDLVRQDGYELIFSFPRRLEALGPYNGEGTRYPQKMTSPGVQPQIFADE